MARTPTSSSDTPMVPAEDDILIREIDEAVRQDDALTFLRDHGAKVLGGIIVLIGGLGGYMLWDGYREGQLEAQSETLVAALDYATQNDLKTAGEKVAPLLDDGSPGARTARGCCRPVRLCRRATSTRPAGSTSRWQAMPMPRRRCAIWRGSATSRRAMTR